uniref:Transposon Ty1-NL2 Gag-Pol polyprotein n=1 Tax=Talaromyces marneffei PM1 TaxID=1077442 RepID=A0A093V6J0_TALMA
MPSLFKLRKTLRSNGVYVAKDQRHPAIPLAEARAEAERHQWTESELIQLIQQREQPNSPDLHITYGETIERLRNPTNRAPQQSAHFEQPETPSPPTATLLGPMTRQRSQLLQPQEATLKAPLTQRFYNPTTPGMTTTYEPTVPPTTPGRQDVEVSYTEQNGLSYNANISHLRKAYNEEIKYGGSEDTFDMCYRIFIELCGSTGVHTAEAMRRALWIMLKGDALQFYFDNIEKWTQLRMTLIAVKNNYETKTPTAQPGEIISECLELMLQDLRRLYNKLRPQVRNDVTYHAKLISATRLVPACHAATGKPSPTIPGLVEDLRSSVSQYEDTRQAAAQHPIEAYYTDRRYHRRQSRSPYRGRSLYQNQQQYGDRRRRSSSWNHSPKQEREKALQPYMDRVKAYLTAKEGQPPAATNQDSPDDDEEFKKHEEYSKSLTNDLANRSAAHFLQSRLRSGVNLRLPKEGTNTTSRDVAATVDTPYDTLPVLPQYSFLTEPRYSTNTFIGVLVDTGAAEHSTAGYPQYLAYRRTARKSTRYLYAGQAAIRFGPERSRWTEARYDNANLTTLRSSILIWDHSLKSYLTNLLTPIRASSRKPSYAAYIADSATQELPDISTEAALQMAVKAVNDTAGPDGLVPTLLVFGAYPRMTEYDPPAPTITQRAAAIRAQRQVTDAVNTRNGPSSTAVHRLPLNSDVLVWREGNTGYAGKWTGPEDYMQHTFLGEFTKEHEDDTSPIRSYNGVYSNTLKKKNTTGHAYITARFVNEVKNNGTDKAFEKSRLVVQAYNDEGKEISTIFSRRTFLKVVRPLYGIPEAGNHWFRTYHNHHTENLNMDVSTYDPCLLHCSDSKQGFGIIGMQTDDTLIVANDTFAAREEEEIRRAKILCKPREQLTTDNPLKFNGAVVTETAQGITLTQKRTCSHIRPVQDQAADTTNSRGKVRKDATPQEQYIAQRALGAYIASMSQPEASFDLSYAAQATDPQKDDIKALNKRLQWQIDNPERGLRFVELDVQTLRLIAFVDASFANNKDYSSQLGYVIVLADEANNANILHWSSTKCKRITRSVLGSETYALANGFDAAAAIKSTLTQLLHLTEPLPLIVCTDSKSLYECLVKLGTTHEKRLMIDLMCLRQSYERQEITEVRWIDGNSNPADAMTKSKPCHALQELIDTNKLRINVDGWEERSVTTRSPEPKAVRFATPLESPDQ